jgi:bla regulator protein BlaR1
MDILQMSTAAGVLILVIVLLRLISINRLPKTMFIVLWGIVVCRLVIPLSIPAKFGLPDLLRQISATIQPQNIIPGIEPGNGNIFYGNPADIPATAILHLPSAVTCIWIAGLVGLALYFSVSFFRCCMEVRTAIPVKGTALIDRWLISHKIRRPLMVLVSDKVSTPLAYGLLKPRIVLPKSIDFSNEMQLNYILVHELIHIKRFDSLWKIILIIALCFHWFNPLVWVLYVLMNRDLEIACDEKVLRIFGRDTRSAYALSLIEMAESRAGLTPVFSGFSRNATQERVVSIMKYRKTSAVSLVFAFILVASAAFVFTESEKTAAFGTNGTFQMQSSIFSVTSDNRGVIYIRDSSGKVISKAAPDKGGKAVLTDCSDRTVALTLTNFPVFKMKGTRKNSTLNFIYSEGVPGSARIIASGNVITDSDAEDLVSAAIISAIKTVKAGSQYTMSASGGIISALRTDIYTPQNATFASGSSAVTTAITLKGE